MLSLLPESPVYLHYSHWSSSHRESESLRPPSPLPSAQLPLTAVRLQQLQNPLLNPGGGVAFGEEFPQIVQPEADLLLLICLWLPENFKNLVHGQFPGLAQLFELDSLGQGRGAVLALHGFQ